MLRDFVLPLAIDADDIDGILYALEVAGGILLFGFVIFVVLYAFDEYERWREDRKSPVEQLVRDRHFGGV